jgi:hypothetical protein
MAANSSSECKVKAVSADSPLFCEKIGLPSNELWVSIWFLAVSAFSRTLAGFETRMYTSDKIGSSPMDELFPLMCLASKTREMI